MVTQELAFETKDSIDVDFELNGQKLRGKLILNPNEVIRLEIINDNSLQYRRQNIEYIQCVSKNDKISLYECDVYGAYIYPKYILFGNVTENEFDGFRVCIGGLSSYLKNDFHSYNIEDEFTYKFNKRNFSISLVIREVDVEIYDDWSLNIKTQSGINSDTIISERHLIFYAFSKPQSLEKISSDAKNLKLMFSLLTMIGLNIDYLWVTSKNNGNSYPLIFNSQRNDKKVDFHKIHSLIFWGGLDNVMWRKLFFNLYSNERFNVLWPSLVGMYLYEGYWEYNILGTMSLFDAYVTELYKPLYKKRKVSSKLKETIKNVLDDAMSAFDHQDKNEFFEIKDKLSFIISSEGMTLVNKYNRLMDGINEDIKNSFGMGLENFNDLKELRNKIAHGHRKDLNEIIDFTSMFILKNRLLVLLTYLALKDLGISDKYYAESTNHSKNKILIESKPQKKWLEKYLGVYTFYNVSSKDYEALGNGFHIGIVLAGDANDDVLSYSRTLSQVLMCIENDRSIKFEDKLIRFNEKILTYGYRNFSLTKPYKIYIKDNQEFKEMHSPVIINFHS